MNHIGLPINYRSLPLYVQYAEKIALMTSLLPYLDNAKLCLDLASGWGRYATIISKYCEVICVDRSVEMLMEAKRRNVHALLVVADAHYLPFRNKVFDYVYCVRALKYFDNPFKAIKEIIRVAKKGVIIFDILIGPSLKSCKKIIKRNPYNWWILRSLKIAQHLPRMLKSLGCKSISMRGLLSPVIPMKILKSFTLIKLAYLIDLTLLKLLPIQFARAYVCKAEV